VRRHVWTVAALLVSAVVLGTSWGASKDSPAAAKTRKKLKEKLSVNYKDTRLREIVDNIQKLLDNKVSIKLDNDGGVSNNLTLTYSADEKPLETILDEMFAKNQLGYVIISNPKDRRDGFIIIKKGKQRGYDTGEEPVKATDKPARDKPARDKDTTDDEKPKDSSKPKDKASKDTPKKDKGRRDGGKASKDKTTRDGDEDPGRSEKIATAKLKIAKMLQEEKLIKKARERYRDLIKQFPNTKAAEEAREILKKLEK
jgi:hypothetical protein